jgi:hypothetical protein
MKGKSSIKVKPLFSELDRRRRIPINEVALVTGFTAWTLRQYALDGTIPGARQAGPGKRMSFDLDLLEAWWQEFNAPKEGGLAK